MSDSDLQALSYDLKALISPQTQMSLGSLPAKTVFLQTGNSLIGSLWLQQMKNRPDWSTG
jgi:hypothetical protein